MMNGIVLGTILIFVGALMSYYTGMLIVKCSVATKVHRYEDFAQKLYVPKCRSITSVLNLLCLMGFIMSYIVYIKSMCPQLLFLFWEEEQLPLIMGPSPRASSSGAPCSPSRCSFRFRFRGSSTRCGTRPFSACSAPST